jgi:predicted acylesterase/phospholipase RssA
MPNCTIWQAARATCADPQFFKSIDIEGPGFPRESYIGGGMGRNNPIEQLLEEAHVIFPDRHVACIVSIGAGHADTIRVPKPGWLPFPPNIVGALEGIASDCERSAQDALRRFGNIQDFYFRFSVKQRLQTIGLAQLNQLPDVSALSGGYVREPDVDKNLTTVAALICERGEAVLTARLGKLVSDLA